MTGGFPSQKASNDECVFRSWCHHVFSALANLSGTEKRTYHHTSLNVAVTWVIIQDRTYRYHWALITVRIRVWWTRISKFRKNCSWKTDKLVFEQATRPYLICIWQHHRRYDNIYCVCVWYSYPTHNFTFGYYTLYNSTYIVTITWIEGYRSDGMWLFLTINERVIKRLYCIHMYIVWLQLNIYIYIYIRVGTSQNDVFCEEKFDCVISVPHYIYIYTYVYIQREGERERQREGERRQTHRQTATAKDTDTDRECQWIMPSLVQIIQCCLFSANPLSEPIMAYC